MYILFDTFACSQISDVNKMYDNINYNNYYYDNTQF